MIDDGQPFPASHPAVVVARTVCRPHRKQRRENDVHTQAVNTADARRPVVCVDLDGTLIHGDVLWESALALVRDRPVALAWLVVWALKGRAHLKRQVARHAPVDAKQLPYRADVVKLIEQYRVEGRTLVLATASDEVNAERVAQHLGLFSRVLASDGTTNLSGSVKADLLVSEYGAGGFDYLGNGSVDMPVWKAAGRAIVVGADSALSRGVSRLVPVHLVLAPARRGLPALVRAMRPYQWVKNLLVFLPLLTAHALLDPSATLPAIVAFGAFCFCASAIYLANDLLDIEADRAHARKRHRPIAAGELDVPVAIAASTILALCGLVSALLVSAVLAVVLAIYAAVTMAYSLVLKRRPVLDVFVLAGLYVLRIVAGGVASGIALSTWLLAFALFLFLSLAFIKRHAEVSAASGDIPGRGYSSEDRSWLQQVGLICSMMAVLVLALYVASPEVSVLYSRPRILWLLCPVLLFWLTDLWFRASRRSLVDDPILVAVRDPLSYVVAALSAVVLFAAT